MGAVVAPPDANGAVGATEYVQWVNFQYGIYDKFTGALIAGPIDGNSLWLAAFGEADPCGGNNSGDPTAQYDKAAGRWVLMQPVFKSPYYICVAVSQTSDATGAYNLYEFNMGSSELPDYPKLGIWPASRNSGYFLTINNLKNGNVFIGPALCGMDRASMLAGNTATMQCFQNGPDYGGLHGTNGASLPADFDGTILPPPDADENFANFSNSRTVDFWHMHVDFANSAKSTLTGPISVSVPGFSPLCGSRLICVPQQATNNKLDALGDRLMYRLAYRNFGDHESLVANHSVTISKRGAVRWYEFQNPATPTLVQSGNVADSFLWYWMGSIAMDKAGDIAVGFSTSSKTAFPSINYAGRQPSDPAGTMGVHTTQTTAGGGSQTDHLARWGDYSAISVDPTDDCTFFYTNEYLTSSGSFNWSTRINSFKFNSCN